MKKGNIVIRYEALQTVKEKMVTKYVLNPSFTYRNFDRLKSDLQKDFLERLKGDIARTSFELMEKYDVNLAMIISLSKKGYLDKIEEKDSRIKVRNIPVEKRIRKTDNPIINQLIKSMENYEKPILYVPKDENQLLESLLQVININQKKNKNTVVIVPEILSSYKIENVIRKNTLLSVALINSQLSIGELLDYYNEIKNDKTTKIGYIICILLFLVSGHVNSINKLFTLSNSSTSNSSYLSWINIIMFPLVLLVFVFL